MAGKQERNLACKNMCHLYLKVLFQNKWRKITGWPQSRRKNSQSFPGFSRAIIILFKRLSQQKVYIIMTFIYCITLIAKKCLVI